MYLMTKDKAEKLAKEFNAKEDEGWTYKARQLGSGDKYFIAVYDEENYYLGDI